MPGIVIQITGDGAGAAEAMRVIEERMQETAKRGEEMSSRLEAAGEKLRSAFEMVGIGVGIEQAIDKMKEMVNQSIELGVELGHLSEQTGISAENLSTLKYVSDQSGVSFESLSKGFKKLSTDLFEIGNGAKEPLQAFNAIGISEKQLTATGGDLFKVMELVAQRFQTMPDGATKNAVATQLFGRAGQELIPILNEGSDGLEEYRKKAEALGIVLDKSGIEKMEGLHKSLVDVKAAFEGAGLSITNALAPALQALARETLEVLGIGNGPHGGDFGAGIQAIDDWADEWVHAIARIMPALAGLGDQFDKAFPGDTSDVRARRRSGNIKQDLDYFNQPAQRGAGDSDRAIHDDGMVTIPLSQTILQYRMAQLNALIASNKADQIAAEQATEDAAKAQQDTAEKVAMLDAFKTQTPSVRVDPDAYKQQALMAEIQRRVQEQEDENAEGAANKSGLNAEAARQAAGTIGSFADQLTDQAVRGKLSFKSLVDSAISDLERFAMKVMEERALIPALNSLFGLGAGAGAAANAPSSYADVMSTDTGLQIPMDAGGGDIADGGMAVVGDGGDGSGSELFAPKGPGTILPHDVLEGVAKGGGSRGGAPSVMINNVNNSSQPVEMKQGGTSWDADAKQFIIHTVLEDMASGGALAQAQGGTR